MGRPRLYHTNEERKAAAARRAKEHYKRNSTAICAYQQKKYHRKVAENPPTSKIPKLALTEEERKLKNKIKSKQSYERNKSEIQERRRVPQWVLSGVVEFDTSGPRKSSRSGIWHNKWEMSLQAISADIERAFAGRTPVEIALEQVKAFGASHDRGALVSVREQFEGIMDHINAYKHTVLNALGAGAHLADVEKLCSPVSNVIWLLWDVEGGIIQERPVEDMISQIECGRLVFRISDT